MLIKRIELFIKMLKIAIDLVVVVAEAARVFLSHAPQAPPALLRHGPYYYSASTSQPSAYMIGYLP
ncbi:unnamed protein product [Eruca vesicaria subsp. sativa]|uniref:Uncharacterized protein n=1 Tax=Eruca vesicaria subsp. sativa TaxID=29727 RepID=A0ABC8L1B4_ERUVS|nr:unnamed protein product [Eruca vesicaria subsp. sativa]